MSETKTSKSKSKSKSTSKSKPKGIEVLIEGPVHICEGCYSLLKVPDDFLEEEIEKVEDDNNEKYDLLVTYFICPRCEEKNIVAEDEDIPDEKV